MTGSRDSVTGPVLDRGSSRPSAVIQSPTVCFPPPLGGADFVVSFRPVPAPRCEDQEDTETSIMAAADRLLDLMFSWIRQRERCAEQLETLARELESLREKCNAGQCVGSSVAVAGAACLIGAGVAAVLTAGAAAPFLGLLGAAYSGVGVTVSVATKITENFLSGSTLKEARTIEQSSSNIAEEIQNGFERLKAEQREARSFADPDDLDRHVMTEVLRALARRSGLDRGIDLRMRGDDIQFFFSKGPRCTGPRLVFSIAALTGYLGILAFFTFKGSGKKYTYLITKGTGQLVKLLSSAAFKTVLKGGAIAVGGAVGMAFALPEAIDNWTEQIKKNHVTEASQSLRDTAKAIRKMTRVLRDQFDDMK
ncbi:uncharacterized protein LOC117940359 [Etheostoma cragini]|uniref:uncharacterized protein LOC117940359 n=1 Tax=Etheostoma cragini TaxID=417921 RepID=UPI00155F01A9|nr:uncharacterized protein LOC117940359 [Etheostoma cragini]